jgi:hypothetical protein
MIIIDEGEWRDYTVKVAGNRFGFYEVTEERLGIAPEPNLVTSSYAELGPAGVCRVPFSAATCWALTLLLLIGMAVASAWLGFRHRRAA